MSNAPKSTMLDASNETTKPLAKLRTATADEYAEFVEKYLAEGGKIQTMLPYDFSRAQREEDDEERKSYRIGFTDEPRFYVAESEGTVPDFVASESITIIVPEGKGIKNLHAGNNVNVLWMEHPLDCRPSSVILYTDTARSIIQDGRRFKREDFVDLIKGEWPDFWRAYEREYGPERVDAKAPRGILKRLGFK